MHNDPKMELFQCFEMYDNYSNNDNSCIEFLRKICDETNKLLVVCQTRNMNNYVSTVKKAIGNMQFANTVIKFRNLINTNLSSTINNLSNVIQKMQTKLNTFDTFVAHNKHILKLHNLKKNVLGQQNDYDLVSLLVNVTNNQLLCDKYYTNDDIKKIIYGNIELNNFDKINKLVHAQIWQSQVQEMHQLQHDRTNTFDANLKQIKQKFATTFVLKLNSFLPKIINVINVTFKMDCKISKCEFKNDRLIVVEIYCKTQFMGQIAIGIELYNNKMANCIIPLQWNKHPIILIHGMQIYNNYDCILQLCHDLVTSFQFVVSEHKTQSFVLNTQYNNEMESKIVTKATILLFSQHEIIKYITNFENDDIVSIRKNLILDDLHEHYKLLIDAYYEFAKQNTNFDHHQIVSKMKKKFKLDFCDYIYEKKDENCYLDEFIQKITSTNLFNNHIDDISELLCSEQLYNLFKTKIVKYTNIRDYNTTLMWNIDFMMQYLIDDKMENDEHVQNVISLFNKINEHQE